MSLGQGFTCAVDIVLCIDVTGSMQPLIDKVKNNALSLHGDLVSRLAEKEREVTQLRVRVVGFRDTGYNTENPKHPGHAHNGEPIFEESDWFDLPGASAKLETFISELQVGGGGDAPESGLEAVGLAINSDWTSDCMRQRHVIVVWTDDDTHLPEENSPYRPSNFPTGVPTSMDELADIWQGSQTSASALKPTARRLVIYAPDTANWNLISEHWEETVHYPSQAGEGLASLDYDAIIDAVAATI